MTDIFMSKLPKGKVLMWHMYFPSSETSVLMMTRDESTMGSLFSKRTRRDHKPKAAETERKERTDLKDRVRRDVTQKIKSAKFRRDPRLPIVSIGSTHMPAHVEFIFTFWVFSSRSHTHNASFPKSLRIYLKEKAQEK